MAEMMNFKIAAVLARPWKQVKEMFPLVEQEVKKFKTVSFSRMVFAFSAKKEECSLGENAYFSLLAALCSVTKMSVAPVINISP